MFLIVCLLMKQSLNPLTERVIHEWHLQKRTAQRIEVGTHFCSCFSCIFCDLKNFQLGPLELLSGRSFGLFHIKNRSTTETRSVLTCEKCQISTRALALRLIYAF